MAAAVLIAALCGCLMPQQDPRGAAQAPVMVGAEIVYEVRSGDSLSSIGARFGVDPAVIARANRLRAPARLRPGDRLAIDNRHLIPPDAGVPIVLNVPQRMLFFSGAGRLLAYPAALGQPTWQTPVGPFSVTGMEVDPTWDVPPSIQEEMRQKGQPVLTAVPPGPSNPLGARWIGLSLRNVGIHGTNAKTSIYRHATHGCVRLHPDDVAELFDVVTVGMEGRVIYEPVLVGTEGGRVYVEVHRDVYRRAPDPLDEVRRRLQEACLLERVNQDAVAAAVAERAGVARDVTRAR